ncbi:MAG: S8 family serine peptidase [Firmicutes bacterium]|nr:S8 family serine peptidase [Bacillota bacterium]
MKIFCVMACMVFCLPTFLYNSYNPDVFPNDVLTYVEQRFGQTNERRIRNTVTIYDDFTDDKIIIVLNRKESLRFGTLTPEDFPEFQFAEVNCITPGFDLAQHHAESIASRNRRNLEQIYGDTWQVNLGNFRRIISLTLEEPSKENVITAIHALEQRNDIISAEPNVYAKLATSPNTEIATSPTGTGQWNLDRINVSQAWSSFTTGSPDVVVGVMDTGIDPRHPALLGRVRDDLSDSFAAPHQNPLSDSNGHGTWTTGVIAAHGVGVAPNVRFSSLRVFRLNPHTQFWEAPVASVVSALNFATSNQIPILNFSVNTAWENPAISLAQAVQNFPGLFVVSAGNHGFNLDARNNYPANYARIFDNVISVGATDSNDRRSIWGGESSNFGHQTVSVFAPSSVRTTHTGGSGYVTYTGTSAAAPHVAGVAALLLSNNPNITPREMKDAILNGADTITISTPIGNQVVRRLNAYGALRELNPIVLPNYVDVVLTASMINLENFMGNEFLGELCNILMQDGFLPSILMQITINVPRHFYNQWGGGYVHNNMDMLFNIPELWGVPQIDFLGNTTSNDYIHFGIINIFESNSFICVLGTGVATIYGTVFVFEAYYVIEFFIPEMAHIFPVFFGEGYFDVHWRLDAL